MIHCFPAVFWSFWFISVSMYGDVQQGCKGVCAKTGRFCASESPCAWGLHGFTKIATLLYFKKCLCDIALWGYLIFRQAKMHGDGHPSICCAFCFQSLQSFWLQLCNYVSMSKATIRSHIAWSLHKLCHVSSWRLSSRILPILPWGSTPLSSAMENEALLNLFADFKELVTGYCWGRRQSRQSRQGDWWLVNMQ